MQFRFRVTALTVSLVVAAMEGYAQARIPVIEGSVVSLDGRPLPGAIVTVSRASDATPHRMVIPTAANGRFRLELGLPLGSYAVRAQVDGFVSVSKGITLSARTPSTEVTFVLTPESMPPLLVETCKDMAFVASPMQVPQQPFRAPVQILRTYMGVVAIQNLAPSTPSP